MPSSWASAERLADLLIWRCDSSRAEVDRGADAGRAEVARLLDRAEHDLVELVRVGQQLVVVDLHDERDVVGVAPRRTARARRRWWRPRCSRPRWPARRCSPGRSTSGSARTTPPPSARCPGRPAGSTRSRCRPGGRGRTAPAGCAAPAAMRSLSAKTRSTKSGPGRVRSSRAGCPSTCGRAGLGLVAEQAWMSVMPRAYRWGSQR